MNIYFFIILVALIGIQILGSVSQMLNLKALVPGLPKEFEGVYDSEEYGRSQRYTRTHTMFDMIESLFDLIVLILFWFLGGFNYLDIWVRSGNYHPIVNGLIYFGILTLFKYIYSLPFSVYSTFVIEEKFGFNKTTVRTFIEDNLKMVFLTTMLGGAILAGLLAFFWVGRFIGMDLWMGGSNCIYYWPPVYSTYLDNAAF